MFLVYVALLFSSQLLVPASQKAKYNGDIYIVNEPTFVREHKRSLHSTTVRSLAIQSYSSEANNNIHLDNEISLDDIMKECNSSFPIPMDYLTSFNATGSLANVTDKSGMCFLRCYYEKVGLMDNWKLNGSRIRAFMWPATGDSIEVCERQNVREEDACVRFYSILQCLILRALVDAKYKN